MKWLIRSSCMALAVLSFGAFLSFESKDEPERPKLMVVITVDQMRAGYLERYDPVFMHGFRRLRDEGLRYDRAMVDHAPTLSWPGHTTIATGVHPRTHGIMCNAFIENKVRKKMFFEDGDSRIVGFDHTFDFSPKRIKVTGIADWIRAADRSFLIVEENTDILHRFYPVDSELLGRFIQDRDAFFEKEEVKRKGLFILSLLRDDASFLKFAIYLLLGVSAFHQSAAPRRNSVIFQASSAASP